MDSENNRYSVTYRAGSPAMGLQGQGSAYPSEVTYKEAPKKDSWAVWDNEVEDALGFVRAFDTLEAAEAFIKTLQG